MKTLLLTLFIAACTVLAPARAAKLNIVAAENFYGGVARQIAGNSATVTSILSNPNQDPHEFVTSAATAKLVADADIIIYSGIGYDGWIEKLLGTNGRPNRIVIDVADLIGAKDGDNPHIWYAPKTMPALADKLAAVLTQRDAADAAAFQKAADDFRASFQPELDEIAKIKAAHGGAVVTATEPVFGWMTDALGFKMLNYDFQLNVMNDTEPTASQRAAFEKSLTSRAVTLLFYNSQVTDPATDHIKQLAQSNRVPIIGVTETQPPDQATYADWMMHELKAVEAGLNAKQD